MYDHEQFVMETEIVFIQIYCYIWKAFSCIFVAVVIVHVDLDIVVCLAQSHLYPSISAEWSSLYTCFQYNIKAILCSEGDI